LDDSFRVYGIGGECLFPAKPKGSFRHSVGFHAVPAYVGLVPIADDDFLEVPARYPTLNVPFGVLEHWLS